MREQENLAGDGKIIFIDISMVNPVEAEKLRLLGYEVISVHGNPEKAIYQDDALTLRDHFAIHAESFSAEAGPDDVAKMLGLEPLKPSASSQRDWALWWAKAEAAYKYMIADAMLAERAKASS